MAAPPIEAGSRRWSIVNLNQMTNDPAAVRCDLAVEAYKRDVDRTLIREMLKLAPEQRILKLQDFVAFAHELRVAGRRLDK